MCNDVIKLVAKTYTLDAYGDVSASKTPREVFAEVRSIGMKEKYEALQAGLNPELTFVLADYYEYDDEDEVVYNDKTYRVIRTYRNGQTIELVVTRDASVPAATTTTASISPAVPLNSTEEGDDGGTESN